MEAELIVTRHEVIFTKRSYLNSFIILDSPTCSIHCSTHSPRWQTRPEPESETAVIQ